MIEQDIKIDDLYLDKDLGFVVVESYVSPPMPKYNKIEIPGTSDIIDLTESLSGDIEYEERDINITVANIEGLDTYFTRSSKLMNYIHGQKRKIIFDKDSGFYWVGRLETESNDSNLYGSTIEIKATVDPYKYERHNSLDPWPWDDLNFFDGIIREYASLPVPSSLTITGRRKKVMPIFHCSKAMQVKYLGNTYNLVQGQNSFWDIRLGYGEHTLQFLGTGTVSVEYRGGSL